MGELFPVLAGVCIGFVVQRIASIRVRNIALFALSMLAGLTASYISGELFVSWGFLLFDILLVFLGAIATSLALTWQQSRQMPR
ncbi:MAG TPA: hypothetical protein PKE45_01765 [Caldilineaceae bacterium]|nr:hypothetical protein [Caldilineaceae bacterium]